MKEERIGKVDHFFNHISVAAIKLEGELKAGDTIHIKGRTTDFTQTIDSIQIEHEKKESAKAGDDIGIKVTENVRAHDEVFKVTE